MVDYQVDGRDAALAALCEWLKENAPIVVVNRDNLTFAGKRVRQKFLATNITRFKQRARISVAWRNELSDRLKIRDEDIVLATNTIIEMFEKELSQGGTVRLAGFGDLKTYSFENGRQIRFKADEAWVRVLNEPLFMGEIGLKRRIKKKKLIRREV